MPTHSELKSKIARLEMDLSLAHTAEQAALAACKGAMEERDAYRKCLELYAEHANWMDGDDGGVEDCWLLPTDGFEPARTCLAKYKGGDAV